MIEMWSASGQHVLLSEALLSVFCGCGIDRRADLGNAIGRKSALLSVLFDQILVGGNVNTVDLVVGHVAFDPLDGWPKFFQDTA